MEFTIDEPQKRGLHAGLLFCLPVLAEKVYESLGWTTLDTIVFMEDETGTKSPILGKNITLALMIRQTEFPLGDIDINGSDW